MRDKHLLLTVLLTIYIVICYGQHDNSNSFELNEAGLKIDFDIYNQRHLRLLNILPVEYNSSKIAGSLKNQTGNEVFLYCTGENRTVHQGNPGSRIEYIGKKENIIPGGKQVILLQRDPIKNLRVESFYEFNNASPVVRRYTKVINEGKEDVGIECLSSAMLYNYIDIPGKIDDNIRIHFAYNQWKQEAQWDTAKPSELGWNINDYQYLGAISLIS